MKEKITKEFRKLQKSRDKYVRDFCKGNNYTLIEISYTMKDSEITETLDTIKI